MDFTLTEDQEMFRQSVRKFIREKVAPLARDIDKKDEFPLELFREVGRLGFLGVGVSEEYGGSSAGAVSTCLLVEEMARVSSGFAAGVMAHIGLGMGPIFAHGSESQKKRYIIPGVRGEALGGLALTEPDAGSDVANIRTTAVKQGGGWILNGTKTFITNGSLAKFLVVAARTGKEKGSKGMSLFIVEAGTPGFRVARRLDKLGWKGSDTAELVFEECRVPDDALLGRENEGFSLLMRTLQGGRVAISAFALGTAEAACDAALEYSKQRIAFGRPISEFQAVRFKLTQMAVEIEASRLLILHAAWLRDNGRQYRKEASMAKLYSSEMCQRVTREAVQIHGGYGFMMEYDVQRHYRDAMIYTLGEGTSEIQNEIIARELGL